jgi:hypothetical protein
MQNVEVSKSPESGDKTRSNFCILTSDFCLPYAAPFADSFR